MICRFHPAAEAEHLDHIAFYESRRTGFGKRYIDAVETALALIAQAPQRLPVESPPNLRRVHLRRFPVTLIFRQVGEEVQIVAVAHNRRRPGYWLSRV